MRYKLIALALVVVPMLCAKPIELVLLNDVTKVAISRIPYSISFPVSISAEAFDGIAMYKLLCERPDSLAVAIEIVNAYNAMAWTPTHSTALDVRWSVTITLNTQQSICLYLGERSDVYLCNGRWYTGGTMLLHVLRKYMLMLK